jgi:hypothetical protein
MVVRGLWVPFAGVLSAPLVASAISATTTPSRPAILLPWRPQHEIVLGHVKLNSGRGNTPPSRAAAARRALTSQGYEV